jgi:hypothetical protein
LQIKHASRVALISAINLSDEEKLGVLRRLDQFRDWHSLDDKRYCLVCGKIITGRQIKFAGGTRGNGPLRGNCPTERCHSIPMDWVLPTSEVLANVAIQKSARREVNALHLDHGAPGNSMESPLRKLAAWFRRAA